MTPAPIFGPSLEGGVVETHGNERHVEENRDGCRVTANARMTVDAGDIPGATGMDPTLGRLGEMSRRADMPLCSAGTFGRAEPAGCGQVGLRTSLLYYQKPATRDIGVDTSPQEGGDAKMGVFEGSMTMAAFQSAEGNVVTTDVGSRTDGDGIVGPTTDGGDEGPITDGGDDGQTTEGGEAGFGSATDGGGDGVASPTTYGGVGVPEGGRTTQGGRRKRGQRRGRRDSCERVP